MHYICLPLLDAMSVIGFLKHYGLDRHFKLNIEPNHTTLAGHSYEHDIVMASVWEISDFRYTCELWCNIHGAREVLSSTCPHRFGMLGSVDSNTGSPDLGWDTDQFPMDVKNTTLVMKVSSLLSGTEVGNIESSSSIKAVKNEPDALARFHFCKIIF